MGTVLASISSAAAATTTTGVFPFSATTITATCLVSATTPNTVPCQVILELSVDNVVWNNADRRTFGLVPGTTYQQAFWLGKFAGSNDGAATPQSQFGLVGPWLYYRLQFTGHDQAVTIAASTPPSGAETAVVSLAGINSTNAGAMGVWTPPQGGPVLITNAYVYCTASAGANSSMNAGVATNATTASSNIIAAQMNAANNTIIVGNTGILLTTTQSVTFTSTANSVPFAGKAYITYIQP